MEGVRKLLLVGGCWLLVILNLSLCCCSREPESYPPPAQRPAVPTPKLSMMLEMADRDAAQHIVKDIHDAFDSPWRWTDQQPTVRIMVLDTGNIKLSADFTLWDVAFKQTGPVELSFAVNDKLLDKVRFTSSGYKHFEKPVPSDWLAADQEATVAVTIDKLYVHSDQKNTASF